MARKRQNILHIRLQAKERKLLEQAARIQKKPVSNWARTILIYTAEQFTPIRLLRK